MALQIDQSLTRKHEEQLPAWVLDLLLGVAITLIVALVISADQGGKQDPDAIAYLFACGFGGLMLGRRRFPVGVLVLTMLLLFAYYIADYPAIGLAVPVAAALYSATETGHLTAAIVVSLLLNIVSTYFRLLEGQPIAYLLGYELVSTVTLMAAAIALGDSTRARRALRAEQEQTARLIEQEHAYRAEQQIQAERVRMARDLHDVIGHSMSVISLHANVASEAIGNRDEEAQQAIAHIRTASSATLHELRATVKLLRNPAQEQPERGLISLSNLALLLENAKGSGLQIDINRRGALDKLPATVDIAAYRIVQEAVTNIIRHANATQVLLTLAVEEDALHLQISDNGSAVHSTIQFGSGITGMQERARLLGGTLTAQGRAIGGFVVSARLPIQEDA